MTQRRWPNVGYTWIDHFHYDVTLAKDSGSCTKDCPQGRSIAGKFKIIHKNTCNAMAAEWVDHITSIMCIIERTSSDISDKPAFTPPGHIKRQQCKIKEALFCKIFDFLSFSTRCVTKRFSGWLLVSSIFSRYFCMHPKDEAYGWSLLKTFVLKACCYKETTWRILDGGYRGNWRS